MLVDEAGVHRQRIRRGEKFSKARSWRATLVPSDDATKVHTLRWLFQTYADTDTGLRGLADQLNAKGVPGPTGGPWYAASIKAILENRNYAGIFTWAKRREGKYYSVAAGQIRERDRSEVTLSPAGKPLAVDNPQEAWIIVEDAHEALIDKALFDRVQARLHDRRRDKSGQSYRTHTRSNDDAYLLSGLVFCAHCGCKMHGSTLISKGHRYPKYFCSTYARGGKNNPYGCGCHAAGQDALVNVLIRKFHESVLSTENVQRFRRILRQQLEGNKEGGSQRLAALRKQIADLDREIDRAAENFLRAPTDLLDLIGEKLTALKRQREYLRSELSAAKSAAKPNEVESEVEAVVGRLRRLGEEMAKAEPARRREVFRLLIERIDLRFDHVPMGKKTACPLQSGAIHLRTGAGTIFGSVSRGDRI